MDSQAHGSTRSPDHEYEAGDCMELGVIQNLETDIPFQSADQELLLLPSDAAEAPATTTTEPSTPKSCSAASPSPIATQELYQSSQAAADVAQVLMKKLSGLRVPELRITKLRGREIHAPSSAAADDISGCSQCEESEDSDDDDLCSTTSSDADTDQLEGNSSQDPFLQPPMLPDVRFHVPLETEDDIVRVRRALMIKGVLEVSCDLERQIVTVSGNVSPRRLLKKVKQVKRNSRIISNSSSINSSLGFLLTSAHHHHHHHHASNHSTRLNHHHQHHHHHAAGLYPPHNYNNMRQLQLMNNYSTNLDQYPFESQVQTMLVAPRPRPTYQSYTFRNRPSSPYLRTYSPSDVSPPSSPSPDFEAWESALRYYNNNGTRSYGQFAAPPPYSNFGRMIFDDYYYE